MINKIICIFLFFNFVVIDLSMSVENFQIGQISFEDRKKNQSLETDSDANDANFLAQIIYETSVPNGAPGEMLILILPLAAGATDSLKLELKSTLSNSGTYYVHEKESIRSISPGGVVYDNTGEMFTCSKYKMINTYSGDSVCKESPKAITLVNHGISTSPINLADIFQLNNETQGYIIASDLNDIEIIETRYDTGYPVEGRHWFDAFFGPATSETGTVGGSVINISACDPRESDLSGNCESALNNWFQTKSSKSKMQSSKSIISSRSMKKLKISKSASYKTDGIGGYLPAFEHSSSFDFDPDAASNVGSFSAGDISSYFSEQQETPSGNLQGLEELRKHRLICDIISCGIDISNANFILKTNHSTHGSFASDLVSGPNGEIYGLIWQGGFVKSTDGGNTFSVKRSTSGLTRWQYVNSIIVEPDGTIWITAANVLYKSTDGGETFSGNTTLVDSSMSITNLYRGPSGKIYLSDNNTNYYVSSDGGDNFTKVTGVSYNIKGFAEKQNGDLYIVTYSGGNIGGLYITSDNGSSFTIKSGMPDNNLFNIYIDSNNVMYAGTLSAGVLISTDGGDNWEAKTTANGLGNNQVNQVYVDSNNTLYVATENGGLSYSTDGGNTFLTKTEDNSGLGNNQVRSVLVGDDFIAVAIHGISGTGGLYLYHD